jgi:hypothetical protein
MPALPSPWRRLVIASRTMPVEFYTLLFLPIFGIFGLIFGSFIDDPRWQYTWVYLFIFGVKIMLIAAPVVALIGIAIKNLYMGVFAIGLAGLNCLAYCGVAFVLGFPRGGGFVIGGFLGIGVGYLCQVFSVTRMAGELRELDSLTDVDEGEM